MKAVEKIAAVTSGCSHMEGNLSENDILSVLETLDEKVSKTAKGSSICRSPAPALNHIHLSEEMDDSFCDTVLSFLDDAAAKAGCKPDTQTDPITITWKNHKIPENWSASPEFISEWIEKHEGRFRCIAASFFKNIQDAAYSLEDLMQEIRLAVFRAFNTYDPHNAAKTDPESYFYTVAHNQMKYLCRTIHQKRRNPSNNISLESCYFEETDDILEPMDNPLRMNPNFVSKDNVEDTVILRETLESVHNSVKGNRKIILELTAMGYTQSEISAYLEHSQSSISYHLMQIRKEIM